ncbi:UV DNA damage repair endonuclease UvsE [Halohasta litorea]|uniref:UV DNA damage repair endonuclease UvsE n=1 Tax=Halohasta litorea TaxID=869891 RepID=A0ABD6D2P8_9EURY|nr:UV DNA damage repair endonuclease UvsE [Halohasta litorea]
MSTDSTHSGGTAKATPQFGYAALNRTLREQDIRTNRGMQQATFEDRGLPYAGELAEQNCRGLRRIIEWNVDHDIRFYRISSDLIPWYSQYDLEELPNSETVLDILTDIGDLADRHDLRLTFHPDHFVKLASPTESVVDNSIIDLECHGDLMDAMGLSRTPYNSINIHIGAHYSDKAATGDRFCEAVGRLSLAVRDRLTVENDDKESLWSVPELVESVHDEIGLPVVYDELHHQFTDRGLSYREALELAVETWPDDIRPIVHYSESRRLHEADPTVSPRNHSDYVAGPIHLHGNRVDVMIEAKMKEQAVMRYRQQHRHD